MATDARHIGEHTVCLIVEGEPVDKVTGIGSRALADIRPLPLIKLRRFETVLSSRRISESLNRAIESRVLVNNKPLFGAKQLIGNDK